MAVTPAPQASNPAIPEPTHAPRFDGPCNGSKPSSTFQPSPDLSASLRIGPDAIRRTSPVRASESANHPPSTSEKSRARRRSSDRGLVHWGWFAGRLDQPVSFEQDAVVPLGLEQKADRHERRAAQQSDQHYARRASAYPRYETNGPCGHPAPELIRQQADAHINLTA
jgi:hypothetical protein